MPGPWEKYGGTAEAEGPWQKYAKEPEPVGVARPFEFRLTPPEEAPAPRERPGMWTGMRELGQVISAPGRILGQAGLGQMRALQERRGAQESMRAGGEAALAETVRTAQAMRPISGIQDIKAPPAISGRAVLEKAGFAPGIATSIQGAILEDPTILVALPDIVRFGAGAARFAGRAGRAVRQLGADLAEIPAARRAALATKLKEAETAQALAKAAEEEAALQRRLGPEAAEAERLSYSLSATGPGGKPLPSVRRAAAAPSEAIPPAVAPEVKPQEIVAPEPSATETPIVLLDKHPEAEGIMDVLTRLHQDTGGELDLDAFLTHAKAFRLGNLAAYTKDAVRRFGDAVKPYAEAVWRAIRTVSGQAPRRALPEWANVMMADAEVAGNAYAAGWKARLADAASTLSKDEQDWLRVNMKSTHEAARQAPAGMPNAQRYMDTWRDVAKEVRAKGEAVGMDIGEIEDYFPHWMTEEARFALAAKKGSLYEAISKQAGKVGIDVDELSDWVKEGFLTKRSGSLEKHRLLAMPETVQVGGREVQVLQRDPFDVLPSYLDTSGRRIANVETFGSVPVGEDATAGTDTGKAVKALAMRIEDPHAAALFKEQMRMVQGEGFYDPIAAGFRAMRPVTSVGKAAALTTSAISNAVQGYAPVISALGEKRFAKALGDVLSGAAKQDVDLARRLGAWHDDAMFAIQEGVLEGIPGELVRKTIKWTGSGAINENINKVMAVGIKRRLDEIVTAARTGDKGALKEFDAMMREFHFSDASKKNLLAKGPTHLDYARVMQYATARSNAAQVFATEVPRWMTHPWAKDTLLFTGIVRTIGNAAVDAVDKARAGNIAPLARMLGYTVATTVAKDELVNWLKKKDPTETERLKAVVFNSNLMGMLGWAGQRAEYGRGKGPVEAVMSQAPIWARTLDVPYKLIARGDLKPLREAVPLIDIAAIRLGGEPPLGTRKKAGRPKGRYAQPPRARHRKSRYIQQETE